MGFKWQEEHAYAPIVHLPTVLSLTMLTPEFPNLPGITPQSQREKVGVIFMREPCRIHRKVLAERRNV
jgi:hypothetical protein